MAIHTSGMNHFSQPSVDVCDFHTSIHPQHDPSRSMNVPAVIRQALQRLQEQLDPALVALVDPEKDDDYVLLCMCFEPYANGYVEACMHIGHGWPIEIITHFAPDEEAGQWEICEVVEVTPETLAELTDDMLRHCDECYPPGAYAITKLTLYDGDLLLPLQNAVKSALSDLEVMPPRGVCPVCCISEDDEAECLVQLIRCSHRMCFSCYNSWRIHQKEHMTCPVCRTSISPGQ